MHYTFRIYFEISFSVLYQETETMIYSLHSEIYLRSIANHFYTIDCKSFLHNSIIFIPGGCISPSIYKFGLSVCLSVCLYPINVKTAEPIGPKFFVGHPGTPGKVYE